MVIGLTNEIGVMAVEDPLTLDNIPRTAREGTCTAVIDGVLCYAPNKTSILAVRKIGIL